MGEMERESADDKPLFFLPSSKQRYYAVEPGNVSMVSFTLCIKDNNLFEGTTQCIPQCRTRHGLGAFTQ